ncbi:HRDC domain [Musa troglodytarum]|uniref:HRDC domain n=1 Tax=Musa troglodytarum TaxID=320322 RepID=A0A9E7KHX2_9LILI|nr:HRDC domain [Musa troglodytarum]
MEADSPDSETSLKQKGDDLHALVSGSLAAAVDKAFGSSRGIPSGKDFHFFYNFDEFKAPVKEIKDKSESSLRSIAASGSLWGSKKPPQLPDDLDDAYDWVVNLNDEFLDRLAVSMDEFKNLREKEEEAGGKIEAMDLESGFQLVYGKKKKGAMRGTEKDEGFSGSSSSTVVNVATKDKRTTAARSKVPFHIPTIPRPQDQYNILVNNNNQPFEHVWLERSRDGRFIHPLENLAVPNFIDRKHEEGEPVQPLPLERTPFKQVESVNELKMVAAKLRGVDEFAVDLEHNQYRSFQGLTCLMQISTRTEDFVIDTLKLRIHVGPHMREVFKDPSKRKIMHGADRDIIWLQRDFGIYASRVLQLERNSLEYLLHHFCGVSANKEYQNADWRLRPLPVEMLKYAREDTHYLLYIYDQMKSMLLAASLNENDLLLEVYKRSSEICMQLYEKEIFTDTSFLHIYGLSDADLNSKQLAVAAGLCQWRDNLARAEDESTGYILPNKTLLEIARQMPVTSGKLQRLVKSKHPFVERHLNSVIGIIKSSIANSSAFEGITEQLKEGRLESNSEEADCNTGSVPATDDPMESTSGEHVENAGNHPMTVAVGTVETFGHVRVAKDDWLKQAYTENLSNISSAAIVEQENNFKVMPSSEIGHSFLHSGITKRVEKEMMDNRNTNYLQSREGGIASVQLQKKSSCAFGALFGNSSSRKKPTLDKVGLAGQNKNANKVEQIKSTVALPFYHFCGGEKTSELHVKEVIVCPVAETLQQHPADLAKLEVIPLDRGSHQQSPSDSPMTDDGTKEWDNSHHPEIGSDLDLHRESIASDEPMSPSDLTSSFEKCFQSINERRNCQRNQKSSQKPEINFNLSPFDYAAARKNVKFDDDGCDETKTEDRVMTLPDSRQMHRPSGQAQGEERSRGSQQVRRRQAFPPSGNRSTTYH